jgi:integrase
VNDRFSRVVEKLGMVAGREEGFVVHSLRHFFETTTVNAGIPQQVINAWLGHKSEQSMAAVYYHNRDEQSQQFMTRVPFGLDAPAVIAGEENLR